MISLSLNHEPVKLTAFKFPAGEQHFKIDSAQFRRLIKHGVNQAKVSVMYESDEDIVGMLLVTDAARRLFGRHLESELMVKLSIPYLPHARQDRVANSGESLSVKVIADLINSQNYYSVYCEDLHSDVSAALINNLQNLSLTHNIHNLLELAINPENTILVSPDAGALKKVQAAAKRFGFNQVICAEKARDTKTGEITGTRVNFTEHIGDKDFLILDDICDGGKTFIELAKVLRSLTDGKINLFVSHGIFSKGGDVFDGIIDHIYTGNLMGAKHPLITEI